MANNVTTSSRHGAATAGLPAGNMSTNPKQAQNDTTVRAVATTLGANFSEPESANPLPPVSQARLNLDVAADNYRPVDVKGFTEQRPEIIAAFEFEPAFDDGMLKTVDKDLVVELSPVAQMIDTQITARQLRAENIIRLLNELKNDPKTEPTIIELERRLTKSENLVENEIKFLRELVQKINDCKRSFSVKFNDRWIADDLRTRSTSLVGTDPVRDVFVNLLGFSDAGFKTFTDTKVLLQLVDDLRNMLRTFSPQLIARPDERRANDQDPFNILRMTDATGGATPAFDITTLKSESSADVKKILTWQNLAQFQGATRVINSPEDRLRMMFAVLSRELRASVGLSIPSVRTSVAAAFDLSPAQIENNIFDHILGEPGRNIFDETSGLPKSLVKLFRIQTDDGDVIFPFESTFIKRGNRTLIPGHAFYVSSITKGVEKFNTVPLKNYATTFSNSTAALANVVEAMFDVNVVNSQQLGLNADDLFKRFMSSIKPSVDELTQVASQQDIFFLSMLNAAADDVLLKHMLVLYLLWAGVNGARQANVADSFFEVIARAGDFKSGLTRDGATVTRASSTEDLTLAIRNAIELLQPSNRPNDVPAAVIDDTLDYASSPLPPPPPDIIGDSPFDVISKMMGERLFALVANKRPYFELAADRSQIVELSSVAVSKMTTLGDGDPSFILRSMLEFINSIDSLARGALSNGTYFSTQNPGLTKLNGLGAHTIVWFVVEMYTTFFKLFPVTTFSGAARAAYDETVIAFFCAKNQDLIEDTKQMFNQVIPGPGLHATNTSIQRHLADVLSAERNSQFQAKVDQMLSIREKFRKEDEVIRGIVNILLSVGNSLRSSSTEISRFFDQNGPNKTILAELRQSVDFNDKLSTLDVSQITLSRNSLAEQNANKRFARSSVESNDDATRVGTLSPFIDDTTITPGVRAALFSMLSSPKFVAPAAENLRILSVALPAGFLESMQERLSTFLMGQNLRDFNQRLGIQSDLIKVNVYMQDLLFEDVVFKPKSFVFELDRFVSMPDFSDVRPDDKRSFETLVRDAIRTRSLSVDGSEFVSELGSRIASDKSYNDVISAAEKRELAQNHVTSYLLKIYLKILTGVDLSEDNFYMNDQVADLRVDAESRVLFENLISTRVSGFVGRAVTLDELKTSSEAVRDLLSRLSDDDITAGAEAPLGKILEEASKATNVEISEDLSTFMKVFSPASILFGAGARRIRSTSPKLFERIFHIAIDPDDFEIDHSTTVSTGAGQGFLASQVASRLIVPVERPVTSIDAARQTLNALRPIRFDPTVRREIGDLSLQQFFVSIEQLPELSPLSINRERIIPRIASPTSAQPQYTSRESPPRDLTFESTTSQRSNESLDFNRRNTTRNDGIDWSKII